MVIPYIIAVFLALNMGGSGTGPSFSAAYGANVISKRAIPILFGVMVMLGAFFAGGKTAKTLGSGIVNPYLMNNVITSIVLFAVAASIFLANLFGIPQSTSQSAVFALAAVGLYFNDFSGTKLFIQIIPSWFVLPIVSFLLCFLIGRYIYRPFRKRGITMSLRFNNSPLLKWPLLIVSLYVAFSIGSNNVANAVGPLISMTMNQLNLSSGTAYLIVFVLVTLIIAPCFGFGSSIFGGKILQKTGKELFLFGRIEATIIAFVSGSMLLAASLSEGIPTSLVQLNVGAILGIGIAKLGSQNILRKTEVQKFFFIWIISPVVAFSLTLSLIYIGDKMNILF